MILTFFCKRGRHSDCPGEWPMDDRSRHDYDCSFDIKMIKCICNCHDKPDLIIMFSKKTTDFNQ